MATATSSLEILVKLKDETKSAFGSLGKSLEGLGGIAKKAEIALAGVGVAAGTGLAFAVKAAADAQVEMAKVDTVLQNMGASALANKDALLQAAGAAVQLGFDDEEAAVSIANLYQRTGDLTEATKLNALAMDLARQKGIGLGEASNMVGMVMSGNGRALKQYGIEISETLTPMQALEELQKKVAGGAENFAGTFAGQVEILKTSFGNMVEQIGEKVLPILTTLATKYVPIIIEGFDRFADSVGKVGNLFLEYLPSWEQFKGWIDSTKNAVTEFITLTAPLWEIFKQSLNDLWMVIKFQLWPSIQDLWKALEPLVPIIGVALYLAVITFTKALTYAITLIAKLIEWAAALAKFFIGSFKGAIDGLVKAWDSLTAGLDKVITKLKSVWEWAKKAYDMAKNALSFGKGGDKKETKVDDAVISPTGNVVSTNPRDWLIATQNPALLGAGAGGGITINLNGDMYTDAETSTKFADQIAWGVKNQLLLGGIRA